MQHFSCARLVLDFRPFALRYRVGNNAGTGLHVECAVLDHRSAGGNGKVDVAVEAEVTYRISLDAALAAKGGVDFGRSLNIRNLSVGLRRNYVVVAPSPIYLACLGRCVPSALHSGRLRRFFEIPNSFSFRAPRSWGFACRDD